MNRLKVRKARFLVLKRSEKMSDQEKERLEELLALCPPLRDLRRLVDAPHDLFDPGTTEPKKAEPSAETSWTTNGSRLGTGSAWCSVG